jgi:chemotaxis protein CheD
MERLINGILKSGGRKERLEVKVFGGGNVMQSSAQIGSINARFIREFLRNEGYRIVSEDLEGELPRSVHYFPVTGKVMIRQLRRREDMAVVVEEARYRNEISKRPIEGDIELF